jgi:hypothetical protein
MIFTGWSGVHDAPKIASQAVGSTRDARTHDLTATISPPMGHRTGIDITNVTLGVTWQRHL